MEDREIMVRGDRRLLVRFAIERLGFTEVDLRGLPTRSDPRFRLWNRRRVEIDWVEFDRWAQRRLQPTIDQAARFHEQLAIGYKQLAGRASSAAAALAALSGAVGVHRGSVVRT